MIALLPLWLIVAFVANQIIAFVAGACVAQTVITLAFVAFAFVVCCLWSADEDKSEAQRGVSESSTTSELPVVAMLLLSVEATRRAAPLAHLFIKTQF